VPVKELCRKHGFWRCLVLHLRAKFGGMQVEDAKRLKALEAENAKMTKLLAEAMR
jgi:putative transposase